MFRTSPTLLPTQWGTSLRTVHPNSVYATTAGNQGMNHPPAHPQGPSLPNSVTLVEALAIFKVRFNHPHSSGAIAYRLRSGMS